MEVLQKAQEEFVDYKGTGTSIIEKSHRGADYVEVDAKARERLVQLLGLGDDFEVMFLQGEQAHNFLWLRTISCQKVKPQIILIPEPGVLKPLRKQNDLAT